MTETEKRRSPLTDEERRKLLEEVELHEDEGYSTPEEEEELYEGYDEDEAYDRSVIDEREWA